MTIQSGSPDMGSQVLVGAGTGAAAGSAGGPWGAAIGAGIGALGVIASSMLQGLYQQKISEENRQAEYEKEMREAYRKAQLAQIEAPVSQAQMFSGGLGTLVQNMGGARR